MNSNEINKTHFTIGEVSNILGIAPSVIRFWEKEFTQLKPQKTAKGIRKYTKKNIETLQLIHHLVKVKGMTLEGARAYLNHQPTMDAQAELLAKLKDLRKFLTELKNAIPK